MNIFYLRTRSGSHHAHVIGGAQAKRVTLYLARSRPDRLLDEMMTELQTVETLNCLIERMETPPFYRLTSMRKTSGMGTYSNNATAAANGGAGTGSGGSGGVGSGVVDMSSSTNVNENETEHTTSHASAGMIHTKRHSGDDPSKIGYDIIILLCYYIVMQTKAIMVNRRWPAGVARWLAAVANVCWSLAPGWVTTRVFRDFLAIIPRPTYSRVSQNQP